jgi:hypothetical protein
VEPISALAADRKSGISLGGGLRKVRFARRNAGKGGGYRVIHFYRSRDMPLFLLTVLVKNEKANISPTDRAELIELCDLLADTYGK